MTPAPLGAVSVASVIITGQHSSVVVLVDESQALREWLWQTPKIYRGRAMGKRFRLTIDSVTIEARKVFARPSAAAEKVFVTITTEPGSTHAAVLGRKVGKPVHEIALIRTSATRRQGELTAKATGPKRVRIEGAQ
jgi:hypothetical protein